jgi:hypothetical protein
MAKAVWPSAKAKNENQRKDIRRWLGSGVSAISSAENVALSSETKLKARASGESEKPASAAAKAAY